jgi:hypothetical protein
MKIFFVVLFFLAGVASWNLLKTTADIETHNQPRTYKGRIIEAIKMDSRLRHEKDPRWPEVVAAVESARQRFEDAIFNHYGKENGDFLQFRAAREEILYDLGEAIGVLNDMLIICAQSKSSQVEISKQLFRAEKLSIEIKQNLRH